MGAASETIASVAGSLLNSSAQSGQKDNTNVGQVSAGGNISSTGANVNNFNNQPAASNTPQVTSSNNGSGDMDWGQMAEMAKGLASKKKEPKQKEPEQEEPEQEE